MANIQNVLFLCRDNAARSIMAEAILNSLAVGRGHFRAFSAGSHPAAQVDYFAFEQVRAAGMPAFGLQTKDWGEFTKPQSPPLQFVFSLDPLLAGDHWPQWTGYPLVAQWHLDDPALVQGDEPEKRRAFSQAFIHLYNRINIFASLPLETLDRIGLQRRLDALGE